MESTRTSTDEIIPSISPEVHDYRRPYEKRLAVYLVLTSFFFQHAAFLTFENRLASSVKSNGTVNWTRTDSFAASYLFSGTDFVAMIVFAVASDAVWGRAKAIIIGFPILLIGVILMTIISSGQTWICSPHSMIVPSKSSLVHEPCALVILPILFVTALGSALVRANLVVFGIDQIRESTRSSHYVDKCIVVLVLGSLFAGLITSYTPYHWDKPGRFFLTLDGTATLMLFMSIVFFFFGWPYYYHVQAYDSVLLNCFPVLMNAFRNWRKTQQNQPFIRPRTNTHSSFLEESDASHRFNPEENIVVEQQITFLDFAKIVNGGHFHDRIVDDVKTFRNAILIFILILPYRIIYTQFNTTVEIQIQTMKQLKNQALVAIFNYDVLLVIIIGVIILNIFVYKHLRSHNRILTIGMNFVICMCFGCLAMLITGIVEYFRQDQCSINSTIAQPASNLPVYSKLPQDITMGIAQLFVSLGSLEFAFFIGPRSARSLFMSLHFCSIGVASYICDAYMVAIADTRVALDFQCPTNGNKSWHYISYFFILAMIQVIFLIIFIVCQRKVHMIRIRSD